MDPVVIVLAVAAVIGLIPASIGHSKGRHFAVWWLYGAALFFVALPHALLMDRDAEAIDRRRLQTGANRKCPSCAEIIRSEAVVCRFCGRDLPVAADATQADRVCHKCGTPMRDIDGNRYCPVCGVSWR